MADTVTTQTLVSNRRRLVLKITNQSDGTGESAVNKVDVSAFGCTRVRIRKINYSVGGMRVSLHWAATTPVEIITLQPGEGNLCFDKFGGLVNNAGTGITGDITLTTNGATAGDSYSIILDMTKAGTRS
jgi:hypothetical protein